MKRHVVQRFIAFVTTLLVAQFAFGDAACLALPSAPPAKVTDRDADHHHHHHHPGQPDSDRCDVHILSATVASDAMAGVSPAPAQVPQAAVAALVLPPPPSSVAVLRPWSDMVRPPPLVLLFGRFLS